MDDHIQCTIYFKYIEIVRELSKLGCIIRDALSLMRENNTPRILRRGHRGG